MGRVRRNLRPKKEEANEDVYSASLSKADVPSSKELSSDYYNDEVDKFHEEKFQKLMAEGVSFGNDEERYDSEEEVMPLNIEEDDEDEEEGDDDEEEEDRISMGSDMEDRDKDGLPDELAWGQRKRLYYNADYSEYKKKSEKD